MTLTFVNVGYGEAMLLRCPSPVCPGGTFVMVIDGGSGEAGEYTDDATGRIPLDEYAAAIGLDHIDLMVVTHLHEDHLCGLLPLAHRLPPAVLWQPLPEHWYRGAPVFDEARGEKISSRKLLRTLNDYRVLCGLVAQAGGRVLGFRQLLSGGPIPLTDTLNAEVLAPGPARVRTTLQLCNDICAAQRGSRQAAQTVMECADLQMNNLSLMLMLNFRGTRLLLPGDTNRDGYGHLKRSLGADLFKVGHHGQKDGVSAEILAGIAPKMVVCCASSDRRYNSADPGILTLLHQSGAALRFSDCPPLPGAVGQTPPPHAALEITVGPNGSLAAEYLPPIPPEKRR